MALLAGDPSKRLQTFLVDLFTLEFFYLTYPSIADNNIIVCMMLLIAELISALKMKTSSRYLLSKINI